MFRCMGQEMRKEVKIMNLICNTNSQLIFRYKEKNEIVQEICRVKRGLNPELIPREILVRIEPRENSIFKRQIEQ